MKKFLTLLAGLAVSLMLVTPADARWEIRQKGSGAAVWQDGSVEVPTGYPGIVVHITEAGTASTWYTISHKKGNIVKAYTVANSSVGGSTPNAITFKIGTGLNNTWTPVSAFLVGISTTAGRVSSGTPTLTGIGTTRVNVNQGEVIAVISDGAGPTQDATVIIVIE